MTKELILLLLISGTICVAQSTLATPGADVRQNSEDMPVPNMPTNMPNTGSNQQQGNGQQGNYQRGGVPDLSRDAVDLPQRQNQGSPYQFNNRSTRIVGPLRTKSEFQQYAEDATGRQLPVYGRKLFDQVPTTFAPVENAPVPADYVLGPDDQLLIRAWGKIELNSRLTVDRNGQINLPRVGTVSVAGLRYSQVESYLHSAIGALFKDFELNVTLGRLRTIQIYVLGNARQPGAYTVSSLSTLVDALFSSGGPSATGTMRDVQLRRNGNVVTDFDLYDLVARGDKSKDVRLQPGDVIFIPAVGPQVAISGDVNQPGIFELKAATTAEGAVVLAGGMTSLAGIERAVLERIENHSKRTVEQFSLDGQGEVPELKDGDILRILPLSPRYQNAVTLRGNVAVPGLYPWKEGMRISDLIPSRNVLVTRAYWNRQNHLVRPSEQQPFSIARPNSGGTDNLQNDEIQNSDLQSRRASNAQRDDDQDDLNLNVVPGRNVAARDRNSDSETRRDSQSRESAFQAVTSIGKNSAEINWDYALIERLDGRDLSSRLIPFNLAKAIDDPSSPDDQQLKAGDVVTIFSRADLELPVAKQAKFVKIAGEVNAPGIYRMNAGETLRDVVTRAGGLTEHSYLYASFFTRVSTRVAQETELRQASDQMQRELLSAYANATPQPGQANNQQAQVALQQQALAQLSSVEPTGRVVLAMKPDAHTLEDIPPFPLEDGDIFYIPPRLSTVQVAGAVYNQSAFRYERGLPLVKYLNAAGGATRAADSKRMFVIRADGTVVSRQSGQNHWTSSFEQLRLLPGDSIVVPQKIRVTNKTAEIFMWTQFASSMALTAAALNSITK